MKFKLIIFSLLLAGSLAAQDFILKRNLADHYYERFDYYKCIPMYEQLLVAHPGNLYVYRKLADSYRRINDSENAERCYAQIIDSVSTPDTYLYYAQALARNGHYDRSAIWYEKFAEVKPDDPRGGAFAKAYKNIHQFFTDSLAYIIHKEAFNCDESDFAPMFYKNGVVFASARRPFSIVKVWYNWTYSSYLDLYFSYPDSLKAQAFSRSINSIYHEGPLSFSPTQDTLIVTRSNFHNLRFRKSNEGINKLKMFEVHWSKLLNKWVDMDPMPFNSDQYSVGHPAFADNGNTLYFVSDMPGGYGGTDIYVAYKVTDSTGRKHWSNPTNLGAGINSPGNEMFPYVDSNDNLWFASNGWPGLGGLDMFVASKTKDGFAVPKNPGSPINSRFDDFGMTIRNNCREGMFSSDRYASSVGNDDIYRFNLNKLMLSGTIRDTTNENKPLEGAKVMLTLADGSTLSQAETKADGQYEFPLNFDKTYIVKASKDKYPAASKTFITSGLKSVQLNIDLNLGKEVIKNVVMFATIIDKKSGDKLEGVELTIVDTLKNAMVVDTLTSVGGGFRKTMPNIKIGDKLAYRIMLTKKGYLAKSVAFKYTVTSYEIDLNNFLEVALDKIDLGTDIGKLLKINPIYFDLGKWNIRPDAARELDKVVKAMKENPGLVIELGSHTDSRGSNTSNMTLSDKRAKSSAAYIVSQGIDKTRIYGKGYGESQLINKCADGVTCTEEEHAQNRRTEFKIVKY